MKPIAVLVAVVALFKTSIGHAQEKPAVVLKHDGWVAAVAFSPDGKTLASAGADNVVRLWEVGTWKAKDSLKGHTDCVTALAFVDSARLVTGSFDKTARPWDTSGPVKRKLDGQPHAGAVLAVAAMPNPRWIITGGVDGKIQIQSWHYDGLTAKPRSAFLSGHKSWVNGIAVAKGKFATASSDGTVGVWRHGKAPSAEKIADLEGNAGEVRCVAFSPNGKFLAAGNRYHTVRVWDAFLHNEITTLTGHMSDVWSIAFSPDGKTLAAADTDWKKPSKVKLWDTATWKERGAIDVPGEILSIAYSPNGDWLAVGSWDKSVRVFSLK